MNDGKGDLDLANEYLDRAQAIRPNDRTLKHSRATLLARLANSRPNDLTRKVYRQEARGLLKSLGRDRSDPYVAGLTAQLLIDEIADRTSESEGSEGSDAQLLRLVEEAETAIRDGLSAAPEFENLTLSASRLHELLGRSARAVSTLKKAIDARPQLEFIAVAYARAVREAEPSVAAAAVRGSLVHKPYSRPLNQALFELLMMSGDDARDELLVPLRRSFTDDDGNLGMHVHLMRYHYLRNETEAFEKARDAAKALKAPISEKRRPRFPYENKASTDGKFDGVVTNTTDSFAFVRLPGMAGDVYLSPDAGTDIEVWDSLGRGRSIRLKLCFNAYGAVGTDLS